VPWGSTTITHKHVGELVKKKLNPDREERLKRKELQPLSLATLSTVAQLQGEQRRKNGKTL